MKKAEAFAPAKINLTLHVTGQRADGYHLLDSLVVFADIGDRVTVFDAGDLDLIVTGPMAAGVPTDNSNLVLRAARLAGVTGAKITLEKHLPSAAGIGGGSSDAAATLRALQISHNISLPVALDLGADVPVCLFAHSARMSGIGELIAPVPGLPALPAVLVNPGVEAPTKMVFGGLRHKDGVAMPDIPKFDGVMDCANWLKMQRNDLEAPAIAAVPTIAEVLDALRESGALIARMSGTGATCFGVYPSPEVARQAARTLSAERSFWWIKSTMLGD